MRAYDSVEALLAWWMNEHGHEKAMGFGVAKVRSARETLTRPKRSPSTVNRYLSAMRGCWNWGRHAGLVANESAWPSG
jgi:site-specific recombinase XerD